MLLVKYCHSLNIVYGDCAAGFLPRPSRREKRKRNRFPVSPPLTAFLSVSWVVRLVARQLNRHGREQHKPPVQVCNMRHSSICGDAFKYIDAKYTNLCVYLIVIPSMCTQRFCLQSHKCVLCYSVAGQLNIQGISALAFYVTRLARCFPSGFGLHLKTLRFFPISRSTSFHQWSLTSPYLVKCSPLSQERRCMWNTQ